METLRRGKFGGVKGGVQGMVDPAGKECRGREVYAGSAAITTRRHRSHLVGPATFLDEQAEVTDDAQKQEPVAQASGGHVAAHAQNHGRNQKEYKCQERLHFAARIVVNASGSSPRCIEKSARVHAEGGLGIDRFGLVHRSPARSTLYGWFSRWHSTSNSSGEAVLNSNIS